MRYEFFDPHEDFTAYYGRLPHWDQPGVMCFVTWRTIDSIPAATLRRWRVERAGWLRRHGIDPLLRNWREAVNALPPSARRDYHEHFTSSWMECLDECHGACVLRQRQLSEIVAGAFHHEDNQRCVISDYVVMPNHVHLLAQFHSEGDMKTCCRAWKHYTARRINQALMQEGHFWQTESYDHLVRSPEQFAYLQEYIALNPKSAGLKAGEYRHYRK